MICFLRSSAKYCVRWFSIRGVRSEEFQALQKSRQADCQACNSLIVSHSRNGRHEEAKRLYFEMRNAGVKPSGYACVAALKACAATAALEQGRQIHFNIAADGFVSNRFVNSTLIDMYAKCNSLEDARRCFENSSERDLVSWNVLIGAYAMRGLGAQALKLFETMQEQGIRPDQVTFVNILKGFNSSEFIREARLIHAKILSHNLGSDLRVGNSLIDMYSKCGNVAEARRVFNNLQSRDVISWNTMMGAYTMDGQGQEALRLYGEMDRQATKPDKITFRSVLKACASIGALSEGKKIHEQIINRGLHLDLLIGRSLVDMYVNCQSFDTALDVFSSLPARDLILWNTLIAGYAQHGCGECALELFKQMKEEGVRPDGITYVSILKSCGSIAALAVGKSVHAQLSEEEIQTDLVLANSLIHMYAKSGSLDEAQAVFDKLQRRDVVSYNVLIAGRVQHGLGEEAFHAFEDMEEKGIMPNLVTFVNVLKACGSTECLNQGKLIHARIINKGYEEDLNISRSLMDMYLKCGGEDEAGKIFAKAPIRNVAMWNTLIAGFIQLGLNQESLQIFDHMQWSGIRPDCATFVIVLKACSSLQNIEKGKFIHAQVTEMGLEADLSLANTLIDMYAKCDSVDEARKVFDSLPVTDVVSWNALIAGYVDGGFYEQALELFDRMLLREMSLDGISYLSILRACGETGNTKYGQAIHELILQSGNATDKFLGSALIEMYVKCGNLCEAHKVFDTFLGRDAVIWNVMIGGYVHHGLAHEALNLFKCMLQGKVMPTPLTFISILKACGDAAMLDEGKFIHTEVIKRGVEHNLAVGNALIDMYCNCGSFNEAQCLFDGFPERDPVSWNTMLTGYAQHGHAKQALQLFGKMLHEGVLPTNTTFVSMLSACSHANLLENGFHFFDTISCHIGGVLSRQHYACVVDLLCRAGKLLEAERFINTIPGQPDAIIWMSLLAACKSYMALDLGRRCFDCIMKLDPTNTAAYVLMSSIFATSGRWEENAEVRTKIEMAGGRKNTS